MASNANPRNFFDLKQPDWTNSNWDSEFNTIWWKLYTWDNASSACTDWRHLPTNTEFNTLIDALTWNILWWNRWWSTWINNLVNRLKIPLAGIRDNDNTTFSNRGNNGNLWSNTSGEHWYFYQNTNNIAVYIGSINYGVSVRCIKDY